MNVKDYVYSEHFQDHIETRFVCIEWLVSVLRKWECRNITAIVHPGLCEGVLYWNTDAAVSPLGKPFALHQVYVIMADLRDEVTSGCGFTKTNWVTIRSEARTGMCEENDAMHGDVMAVVWVLERDGIRSVLTWLAIRNLLSFGCLIKNSTVWTKLPVIACIHGNFVRCLPQDSPRRTLWTRLWP